MFRIRDLFMATAAVAAMTQAALAADATPQQRQALESRAREHIARFSGLTLDGPDQSYTVRDIVLDDDGAQHVRLDRRYKGLRVIGGDMVLHADANGNLRDVSKTLQRRPELPVTPALTAAQATRVAWGGARVIKDAGAPELVIHGRGDAPLLAWDVLVTGERPEDSRHVLVDAMTGRVLESAGHVQTGSALGSGTGLFAGNVSLWTNWRLVRSVDCLMGAPSGQGSSLLPAPGCTMILYDLQDPSRGGLRTLNSGSAARTGAMFVSDVNEWGNGIAAEPTTVAVDVHYGLAKTWDYFKLVHGRSGTANNGVGPYANVHYAQNYNNAFWSDACQCVTFGDGDGVNFNPFVSLDVVGHEFAHGVTSRTAGLYYAGESGGLNEATSDIFGAAVEFYAANANEPGNYLVGEKVARYTTAGLRTMVNPANDGASSDCWYPGVGQTDVHYSSGVANHFFYLLAEGTSQGQPSRTCTAANTRVATGAGSVAGIGRAKAEKIWYRALTVYMTSTTNFAGARAATLRAAADLYGAGSADVAAVGAAWSAVNVQ